MNLDSITQKNLDLWLNAPIDPEVKKEIQDDLQQNPQKVSDAFYTSLTFGTGGLRGVMGYGTNRMNIYTVRMATQGLANHLLGRYESPSVFIGFDSRDRSPLFAEEAARVLAANGIKVYLCEQLRPTPLVSFGCRYTQAQAAIMITASHNPPEYNGYKVYGSDGGQVVAPEDSQIIAEVAKIKDFKQVKTSVTDSRLIEMVGSAVDQAYINATLNYRLCPEVDSTEGKDLKIIFSSLHGTGITLVPPTLASWGFTNLIPVRPQDIPDGKFPTVSSPNPEEEQALELGAALMEKEEGDLLIATDPDADRVGVALRHAGKTHNLNGNQIACILLDHICQTLHVNGRMPANAAFVKTIATTELFRKIAESYGGHCFDVLTGFKYIAALIREWEAANSYQFLFGGEESYGYLIGTHARDKDAVISSAMLAEAALMAKREGKTLIDHLYALYAKHGVYDEHLLSIKYEESQEGRRQMAQALSSVRNAPPKTLGGSKVSAFEDYASGVKTRFPSGKVEQILLPRTDALLFWLEDGSKLLLRPSGTEPKVKIYCGVFQDKFTSITSALENCKEKAETLIEAVKQLMLYRM